MFYENSKKFIPLTLQNTTNYNVNKENEYIRLIRRLKDIGRTIPPVRKICSQAKDAKMSLRMISVKTKFIDADKKTIF